MADSTIPNLPAFTGTPNGTEVIETVQSGASVKIPSQKIADLATIVTPITLVGMTSLISGSQVSVYKLYVITNSTQGRILVKGLSTTTLEAGALNLTTGASGTYVFGTDTFTPSAGGNANITPITVTSLQNLRSTSALSTTTLYNVTDAVGSTLVLQVYAIASNTNVVYAIDVATGAIGTYNITTDAFIVAVPDLQQVTTAGATTTVGLNVDNGAGDSINIKHDEININNALGNATITSPTLTTATEFRIPDKAGPTETFAMLSDITGGGITKATAAGTDTYTATVSGVAAYVDGDTYLIRFTNGNTTGATLNINSLGAKSLYRNNDGAIIGGDIWDGGEMLCVFNTTLDAFQCIGTSPNSIFAYITNAESIAITKGQVVYAFGGVGDRMTVKLANNTSDATSARTVGVVLSASIAAGQKGIIILQGLLDGLSTLKPSVGSWADGDVVYLSNTAGGITRTKQYAPNHMVYIGTVTTASNGTSGRMYVKIQNGYELDELHNVQAQSPTLKDTLYYDNAASPAQWKTASIATILGFTPEPAITTLPISKGGTNSGTALSNNRVMQSSGSAIVEASAITAARALKSDANGIPTHFDTATEPSLTELALVKGVTGSAIQTQIDGKASKTFVESISLQDSGTSIAAATYTIELYANYAYTINELKIIADAGTCTANLKINSTSVTSISAVSVSNSIATATASGANTVAVGDKITLVTTSNSGLNNLQLTIKTTRI